MKLLELLNPTFPDRIPTRREFYIMVAFVAWISFIGGCGVGWLLGWFTRASLH